jgi:hypothetical protein
MVNEKRTGHNSSLVRMNYTPVLKRREEVPAWFILQPISFDYMLFPK